MPSAALVEQSAAASESLREQAHKLSGAVAGFKLSGAAPAARDPRHADAALLQPAVAPPSVHAAQAQQVIRAARAPDTASLRGGAADDRERF